MKIPRARPHSSRKRKTKSRASSVSTDVASSPTKRYNEIVQVWTRVKDDLTVAVGKALDPYGSVFMMASLRKGNIQQITQMSGMRGLMADPSGRIIELPIRRVSVMV